MKKSIYKLLPVAFIAIVIAGCGNTQPDNQNINLPQNSVDTGMYYTGNGVDNINSGNIQENNNMIQDMNNGSTGSTSSSTGGALQNTGINNSQTTPGTNLEINNSTSSSGSAALSDSGTDQLIKDLTNLIENTGEKN